MNKRSKGAGNTTWCWRRRIRPGEREAWIARLEAAGCTSWTFTERPGRASSLLAVYSAAEGEARSLHRRFGGQMRTLADSAWIKAARPTRIGPWLEIIHEPERKPPTLPRLHIPHGRAFGSGDHATTFMLLQTLARQGGLEKARVLDLGTGSGVLALAARLFGSRHITGTDFDPEAVRTARQNEALNFSEPLIHWRQADVRRLRVRARYDLVLANLFSGILNEAAAAIARSVAPGGKLWLSGILRSQQAEVTAAYRRQGMKLIRASTRGKWVALEWRQPVTRKRPAAAR